MPVVVAGGQAEWPVLAAFDEGQDIGNRRIFIRQRLHGGEPLREDAGPMKQLLIEGAHGHEPLAGEIAPLHADDVEAFKHSMLPVDQPEGDDVPAYPADATDHYLRPHARELVHRRQATNIDVVADLAVTAERCRGGEDHVVADHAVVTDVTVVHEKSAISDARYPALFDGADVHCHALT